MELLKALLIGGGIVAAVMHGPKLVRIIAMRYGFILDAIVAVTLISTMVPAGAAAAMFASLLGLAITLILITVRFYKEGDIEKDWTVKDQMKWSILFILGGWIPWIMYSWWWIIWIAGIIFLLFALRPKSEAEILAIKRDPEILYMRRSTWSNLMKGRK